MMCVDNEEMEIKLVADTGTLFIGFKGGLIWLGLSKDSDPEGIPQTRIFLTDRQLKVGISELTVLVDEAREAAGEEEVEEEECEEGYGT